MKPNNSIDKAVPITLTSSLTQHWFICIFVGLLFCLVLVTWQLKHFSTQQNTHLRELLKISVQQAQVALNENETSPINTAMVLLRNHPGILYGALINDQGQRVAKFDKGHPAATNRWMSEALFGATYTIKEPLPTTGVTGSENGYLQIEVDTHYLATVFIYQVMPMVFCILVLPIIVATLINLLNRHQISKPLQSISLSLSQFSHQPLNTESFILKESSLNPALQQLIEQVNLLCERLKTNHIRRERAEDDLRKNLENLDAIVAERTENLRNSTHRLQALVSSSESRLEHMETLAQHRLDFMNVLGHEIKTNVSTIITLLDDLIHQSENNIHVHLIDIVTKTGLFLLQSVDDVLNIAASETYNIKLKNQPFDLGSLVEHITTIHYAEAQLKGVSLLSQISPNVPATCIADEPRLRLILDTLTQNVLKFCQSGECQLNLGTLDSDTSLVITLRCNCISITEDAFLAIFKPIHAPSKQETSASVNDWGLCLVSKLLTLMNAHTSFSKTDAWFELKVELPLQSFSDQSEQALTVEKVKPLQAVIIGKNQKAPSTHILSVYLNHWLVNTVTIDEQQLVSKNKFEQLDQSIQKSILQADICFINSLDIMRAHALTDRPQTQAQWILLCEPQWQPATFQLTSLGITDTLAYPISRKDLLVSLLMNAQKNLLNPAERDRPSELNAQLHTLSHRSLHVLIVEDYPVSAVFCKKMLASIHTKVSVAQNGLQALESLSTAPFDIILMDCAMPEMDGFETTALIRESVPYEKLPIIGMSADTSEENLARCQSFAMNDCLPKPLDFQALITTLHKWLVNT